MTKNQTEAKTAKAVTTVLCNCGCGEATSSSKTLYKPGHDARHVGMVARDAASASLDGTDRQYAYEDLGSAKLVHKADAMAKRLVEKELAKRLNANRAAQAREAKNTGKQVAKDQTEGSKRAEAVIDGLQEAFTSALAETVAQEEAAHAEALAAEVALRRADIEAQELDPEYFAHEDVKVGRWAYPAREDHEGQVQRNTKRDGSGEWVAV